MRESFGDRGQALAEFLLLGGLLTGSVGLFVKPWMAGAAPWGFAAPFVFVIGYALIEARRQRAVGEPERVSASYDWVVLLWSLACALAGMAAFVIAWGAEPPAPPEVIWTPPEDSVSVDLTP